MSFPFDYNADGLATLTIKGEAAKDLAIKVERLSDGPSEIDELFVEDLLAKKKRKRINPRTSLRDNDSNFCILCLRKCPPESKVTFCSNRETNGGIGVVEAQHKLTRALGMLIELKYRAMCSTCWQLIELITDFRLCSKKAKKKLKVCMTGLDYDQRKDDWMAESTLNAIELNRQMVRKHMDQLDVEETKAKKAVRLKRAKQKKEHADIEMMVEIIPEIGQDNDSNVTQEEPQSEPSISTTSNATDPVPEEVGDYKPSIFPCETCGRNFDGHHSVRLHKIHCTPDTVSKKNYFTCPICTASFSDKAGLRFHLNKHKGSRPLGCRKFCERTFFSNFDRVQHERRCCQESRICDICGVQLKNEICLKKHVANVHGEARHTCDICGRKFRSWKNHYKHRRVHSEERNYVCTVCTKGFKAPYSLKVHMRIHTQEMAFSCHLCEQAFNYKVSLKNHIERHHGSNSIN